MLTHGLHGDAVVLSQTTRDPPPFACPVFSEQARLWWAGLRSIVRTVLVYFTRAGQRESESLPR